MRIVVVGAGAVGSVVGGLLARAGQDVTLVGRPAHVAAIQRDGLVIEQPSGPLTIRVAAAEQLDFAPDLALLAVKITDLADGPGAGAPLGHRRPGGDHAERRPGGPDRRRRPR